MAGDNERIFKTCKIPQKNNASNKTRTKLLRGNEVHMHFLIYMLHLRITMLTVEISDHQCKFHCQTLRFCLCSTELSLRPVDEAPEAGVTAPLHSPSSPLLLGEVRELKTERSLSPPHTGQRMWSEVNAVEPKKKIPLSTKYVHVKPMITQRDTHYSK